MEIILENISKKYNRSSIFKNISYRFNTGKSYAILGGNGSGKSTLLQIISGYQSPSKGDVWYETEGKKIGPDNFFSYIALATPYMELPEEFSLMEMLQFHAHFKKPKLSLSEIPEVLGLGKEREKELKNFSSGMRQKLRLGLALLFESDVILLDEPTTHLDKNATEWYKEVVQRYSEDKILIISSNQEEEYFFCKERISVEAFKS